MFRTTVIALAAAAALGTSVASAAPFNVTSIATTAEANALQRVMWYRYRPNVFFVRHRHHRHPADTRMPWRDDVCYLRSRRGDPQLFMRQQASGCF